MAQHNDPHPDAGSPGGRQSITADDLARRIVDRLVDDDRFWQRIAGAVPSQAPPTTADPLQQTTVDAITYLHRDLKRWALFRAPRTTIAWGVILAIIFWALIWFSIVIVFFLLGLAGALAGGAGGFGGPGGGGFGTP